MRRLQDIQIRDPFVLPLPGEGWYHLFGSTDANCWSGPATGFDRYRSRDLVEWEGPFPAFRAPEGFWSATQFWAPEVHRYRDRCYLFASFKSPERCRGVQILVADHPERPFVVHSSQPVTPAAWECLDGTLHVDAAGQPWMVFCHEWVQVHDGEICAVRLSTDLTQALGEPVLLFRASAAPWALATAAGDRITDGPFLQRCEDGSLLMLWSSLGAHGYAMGVANSPTGSILGPWRQQAEPVYARDGGHGMLFSDFAGHLQLAIHTPNDTPNERPVFLATEIFAGGLRVIAGAAGSTSA
ncbi:MAG: family 43 glycosylhydrolase [Planctomycetes bacterium]|nr:family 43 glycosylhydrolase [Planctomycetota bacterium]